MLMLATAVPAVTSVKNCAITAQIPNTIQASLGGSWIEEQKLLASDGAAGDNFGGIVSVDGDTALIGAWYDDDNGADSGSAYVFTRTGTTWTQQAKLLASDGAAGDWFGYSVALSGDTALVGAVWNDDNGNDSGSAYVFTRTGTTWTQQAKLLASDAAAGDQFGFMVAISGDTALVGANWDDDNGDKSGSVYVFTRTGTTWTQQQKLLASDGQAGDRFSLCFLDVSGDTALIGALGDDDMGSNSGSAYVFTRTGTTWTQTQKIIALDGQAGDNFGYYTFLSGDTALIGAPNDDDNGANSGSAYVFTKTSVSLTFSITGGLGVNLKIKNNGTVNATGVPWQLNVKGGLLGRINKSLNGTIDITAGETKTVGTGMLFGFGALTITAKVVDEEKTAKGTQLLIFTIVKK